MPNSEGSPEALARRVSDVLCTGDPLARQLAALTVAPADIPREQLMFAAGAASRERTIRFWRRLALLQATTLIVIVGVGITQTSSPILPASHRKVEVAASSRTRSETPQATPAGSAPSASQAEMNDQLVTSTPHSLPDGLPNVDRFEVFGAGIGAMSAVAQPAPGYNLQPYEKFILLPRGVLAIPARPVQKKPQPQPVDENPED